MAMRYYAPFPGGGDPYRPRGFHALRIGDAERDAVAADLGEHYTAGRLTLEELHERLSAAFAAKTYGQLTHILADLPGQGRLAELAATSHPARPRSWDEREEPTATDRAGRFAALALLMLAMMIWLFTALIFASHGMPHPAGGPYP
jgi:hypothetical protein